MLKEMQFSEIYIACGYTDLRNGIDGLATKIKEEFNLSPFQNDVLFLFCGRRSDRMKALVWEGDGFILLYKRLEAGRFKWPRNVDELRNLAPEQFRRLLEGFTVDPGIHQIEAPENTL